MNILFLTVFCLLLTACGPALLQEAGADSEEVSGELSHRQESVDLAEENLKKRFEEETGQRVCELYTADYERAGFLSAFVLAGASGGEAAGEESGRALWYTDGRECIRLSDASAFLDYESEVIEYEDACHFLFVRYTGIPDSAVSFIWAVRDRKPVLLTETPNYCFMDGERLTLVRTFISSSAGGRIWQRYYIYWDAGQEKYSEYEGEAITAEKFLSYGNAGEMQDRIDASITEGLAGTGGNSVVDRIDHEYIRRENGIININFTVYTKQSICYFYAWLTEKDGEILLQEPSEGALYERGYIFESGSLECF